MQRRDFVKTVGAGSLLAAAHPFAASAIAADTTRPSDHDPISGHVAAPPKAYLFTDQRLIQPGDVGWANPQGKALPLNAPPQPVVDAHVVPKDVPHGIRFVAQPARIDGLHWSQVPGGPVLSRKSFADSSIEHPVLKKPLLPLPHDRVGLRYTAARYPHKYPRWSEGLRPGASGWAWWEKGRLVAVTADEEGEFTTFFVPVMGSALRLNARTPRGGMIKVGLRERKLDDCDPVVGDSLAHPIRWKGNADVGLALGESVALTFRLRRAELFGFEWV